MLSEARCTLTKKNKWPNAGCCLHLGRSPKQAYKPAQEDAPTALLSVRRPAKTASDDLKAAARSNSAGRADALCCCTILSVGRELPLSSTELYPLPSAPKATGCLRGQTCLSFLPSNRITNLNFFPFSKNYCWLHSLCLNFQSKWTTDAMSI